MKIYPYIISDTTSNALRASHFVGSLGIGTSPCRTNSSREERLTGWCGTTNGAELVALGEFDTDIEGWAERVTEKFRQALPDGATIDDLDGDNVLRRLADAERRSLRDAEIYGCAETASIEIEVVGEVVESEGLCWNPLGEEEEWWPHPQPGWEILALEADGASEFPDGYADLDEVVQVLDGAGIPYDRQAHRGLGGRDGWDCVAVRIDCADRGLE